VKPQLPADHLHVRVDRRGSQAEALSNLRPAQAPDGKLQRLPLAPGKPVVHTGRCSQFRLLRLFHSVPSVAGAQEPVYGQKAKSLCSFMLRNLCCNCLLDLSSRSRYHVCVLADIIFIKAECRKQSSVVNANAGSD
jgi:hypothetical protein